MAELKITDLVDQSAIDGLKNLSKELQEVKEQYEVAARKLLEGLKIKVEFTGDVAKLNSILSAGARDAEQATVRLNSAISKQNEIVAQTTNTISRELAEIEKENAKKREAVQVDQTAIKTAEQYIGTLNQNIRLLAEQKKQLEQLKEERKQGTIGEAEYLAKERELKTAMNELNGVINNQQKLANSAEGSYQSLSLQLELLKKAYKTLNDEEKKSAGGQQLAKEIGNLDAALKDAAADMGEFQRNTGNYAIAGQSVKKQLKELVTEAANLTIQWRNMSEAEQQSAEGQELLKKLTETKEKAGDLKDAIGDINQEISEHASDTKGLDQITAGIELLADGYGVAEGAAHLLGLEEEDLAEVQAKMQAIMVVTNGLTKIQNALQEQSAVMLGIKTIQQKAAAAAEAMATKNTLAATVAQKAFNVVAKANPYVLLATALLTVVGALAAFSLGSKKASESQERLNAAMEDMSDKTADMIAATELDIRSLYDLKKAYQETNSELEKKQIIEEAKEIMKQYGIVLRDDASYADMLTNSTTKLTEAIQLQGQIAALQSARNEIFKEVFTDAYKSYAGQDADFQFEAALSLASANVLNLDSQINNLKKDSKDLLKDLGVVAPNTGGSRNNRGGNSKEDPVAAEIARRKLINDAELSIEKEGSAKWLELKKEANKIAYDEDLHNTKLTGDKRAEYEKLLQERLQLQNAEALEVMKKDMEDREREVTDALEAERQKRLDDEEKAFAARQVVADHLYKEQVTAAKKAYADGAITEEEFNEKSEKLAEDYAKKKAKDTIDYLQDVLDNEELTDDERKKLRERLKQAQIDAENASADAAINANKRKMESDKQRMENAKESLSKAGETLGEINSLTKAIFDGKMSNVEKEEEALDEQYEADKERIESLNEAGVISKEEADQRMAALEESKAAKEAELEEKKKKIKEKQAKIDKANSIVQATISTALAVMNALSTVQPFPAAIAMAAVAGAMGAMQIATIAAQPLPKYAEGTDSHKGGYAIVGDGGKQELVTFGGNAYVTPDTPTLVNLPRGARVHPDALNVTGLNPFSSVRSISDTKMVVNPTNVRGIEQRTDETNRLLKKQLSQERRIAYDMNYRNYKTNRL